MKDDRIAMYRFLSIGFSYPENEFVSIISRVIDIVATSYRGLNGYGYRMRGIKNLKKGLKELKSFNLHQLQGIYTGLFIANFPKTPLHPYESFYKEKLIGSNTSDELGFIYKSCGLKVNDEGEFPDYVVFELEFAAFLFENENGCKPIFKEFFFGHLFSWVFTFFDDVMKYKDAPLFYKALSEIGITFLNKEKRIIKELVNER